MARSDLLPLTGRTQERLARTHPRFVGVVTVINRVGVEKVGSSEKSEIE